MPRRTYNPKRGRRRPTASGLDTDALLTEIRRAAWRRQERRASR